MNIVFQITPLNLIFPVGLGVSLTEVLSPQSASSVAPSGGWDAGLQAGGGLSNAGQYLHVEGQSDSVACPQSVAC